MRSVEEAYQKIADNLLWFTDGEKWSVAQAKSSIWTKSTQTSLSRTVLEQEICNDKFPPLTMISSCSKALYFLRDDLLRTTGQRIWGLTFTLYPTGKFNIEYDYNKPEGYEETDEVIMGDEINAPLGQLAEQNKRTS